MNDDNPYRFTGEVEPSKPLPPWPVGALRQVARYRRLLFAATVVYYVAWLPATFLRPELYRWVRDDYVFFFAWLSLIGLFILAAVAIPWVSPRFGFLKIFALLVPLLNVFVLAYVLYRSRRRLENQGVRVGWFVDDYSRATFEPPSHEASSS